MPTPQTRRRFLTTLSFAGAASLIHAPPARAAEGQPETTTVRMVRDPGICLAPQYAAEELLRVEGLADIRYLEAASDADTAQIVANGEGDFTLNFASQFVAAIDRGAPITVLAGVHVGCFELFASSAIHGIADLRARVSALSRSGRAPKSFSARWRQLLASTLSAIFTGSPTRRKSRSNCLQRARSTRISEFHPSRRNCAPGVSTMLSSTVPSIGRGHNISAAC